MKIRKAKKEDLENYLELRKKWLKEYRKRINKKKYIKEFNDILSSKKRFLFIAEENKKVIGFLIGNIYFQNYKKIGYIDDIFVTKKERRKKVGTSLIKEFIKILRKRKIHKIKIGVEIKNEKAIEFYKKLNFKITYYEMEKKIR